MQLPTTIKIKGEESLTFPVEVNDEGIFTTTFRGDEYVSESLRQLRSLLLDAVVASRVEIPFFNTEGTKGVIRGFHAGQSSLLVTWENGEKGTIRTYEKVYPDLSNEQLAELKAARVNMAQARNRVEAATAALGKSTQAKDLLAEALGEDLTVPEARRQRAVTA